MDKSIDLTVIRTALHEDSEVRTEAAGHTTNGGIYMEVTLAVQSDTTRRIGNMSGDVAYTEFTLRIQHPEMLKQFKVGDKLTLIKK